MKNITPQDLCDIINNKEKGEYIIIDVRSKVDYNSGHIDGAKNIPFEDLQNSLDDLKKYETIFVQCNMGNTSSDAYKLLIQNGFDNVVNLEGGLNAWELKKLPTKVIKKSIPLMRQQQIVASALILLSVVLTLFISIYFIFIAAFVGCGLLYAGLSGNCFMIKILSKMPFNKV